MRRLALHQLRAGKLMVFRRRITLLQCLFDQGLDHDAVLRVQIDHAAVITNLAHRVIDVSIIDHQQVRVGHVELDARHSILVDEIRKLAQRRFADVGQNRMETVIDAALWFGRFEAPVQRRLGRLAFGLHRKIDNRRRATKRR